MNPVASVLIELVLAGLSIILMFQLIQLRTSRAVQRNPSAAARQANAGTPGRQGLLLRGRRGRIRSRPTRAALAMAFVLAILSSANVYIRKVEEAEDREQVTLIEQRAADAYEKLEKERDRAIRYGKLMAEAHSQNVYGVNIHTAANPLQERMDALKSIAQKVPKPDESKWGDKGYRQQYRTGLALIHDTNSRKLWGQALARPDHESILGSLERAGVELTTRWVADIQDRLKVIEGGLPTELPETQESLEKTIATYVAIAGVPDLVGVAMADAIAIKASACQRRAAAKAEEASKL
jgi:hypothetical protein